jgi:hypothetical protein
MRNGVICQRRYSEADCQPITRRLCGVPAVFDPYANMPRINRGMVYLGACLIVGIRLAREKQVNVRVIPTSHAIYESIEMAHEIFNRVFRKVPEKIKNS